MRIGTLCGIPKFWAVIDRPYSETGTALPACYDEIRSREEIHEDVGATAVRHAGGWYIVRNRLIQELRIEYTVSVPCGDHVQGARLRGSGTNGHV
jgi:hypothetical protein